MSWLKIKLIDPYNKEADSYDEGMIDTDGISLIHQWSSLWPIQIQNNSGQAALSGEAKFVTGTHIIMRNGARYVVLNDYADMCKELPENFTL